MSNPIENDPAEALQRVRELVDDYFSRVNDNPISGDDVLRRIRDALNVRGF